MLVSTHALRNELDAVRLSVCLVCSWRGTASDPYSLSLQVCVALSQDKSDFFLLNMPARQEVTFAQQEILQRRQSPSPFPGDEQAPWEELPGPPPDPPKQDRPSRSKGRPEAQPSENGAQPPKPCAPAPADYHELAEEVRRKLYPSLDYAVLYPRFQE